MVAGYPEVVRLNADLPAGVEPQVLTPFVLVSDKKVVKRVMLKYFPQLDGAAVDRAYDAARDALADWKQRLEAEGEKVLSEAQAAGKTVVLIAGRPYHVDPLINHGLPDYIASLGVSVVTEDSVMQLAPEPGKLRVVNQWAYHSRLYRAAALAATEPCVELIHLTNFGCGIDAITSDQVAEILQRSGKLYTLLKIDEGDSLGPAKIRIASLLATVEERKAGRGMPKADESDETPAKAPAKPAVFVRSMRETHTILAPQMSPIHFAILEKALSASGYKLKLLPVASPRAIETGLKYVNNDACYPAIVTIGQLVNALKENVEDPDHTALMLAQTCGPCRATNYIALLHRALAEAGFSQVPVVSLSGGSLNEQPGFSISPLALRRAMIATLYGDMLQRLYYATKAHELFKGDAKEKLDEWIERARDVSFRNSVEDFESDMIPMVREFGSIPQDDIEKPRVGIVGEILLKYHPDANRHLTDMILAEGGEPVLSSGADAQFASNMARNKKALQATIACATKRGFRVTHIVTACGSCREGIERLEPSTLLGEGGGELVHLDVMQFVQGRMDANPDLFKGNVLYHASCHPEWVGVHKVKGVQKQAGAIARLTGAAIEVSPGCCGESGMGAIASPLVYNTLRKRKMDVLEAALADYPAQSPILVGCPSCKVGITRSLMAMHERRPVLHTVEWLATLLFRERWGEKWIRVFRRRIAPSADAQGVRIVELDG